MKIILTSFLLLISPALAQEKIPLRLPLGLAAGMSGDSVSVTLKLKGIKYHRGQIIDHQMKFGSIDVAWVELGFFEDGLMKVILRTEDSYSGKAQLTKLQTIADFITNTYDCSKTVDLLPTVQKGTDLMGEVLLQFAGETTMCLVESNYARRGSSFYAAIYFIDRQLMDEFLEKTEQEKTATEQKSKKDL